MIIDNLFNRKPIIVEGSAANDYFTRRKSEEERIAGTRSPVKNKNNPANTDYSKRRAQEKKVEQGVAEGSLEEDKGMTGYNAFKREWRAKHGADAKVPAYDSKEYTSYVYRQNDKKQGVAEGFSDIVKGIKRKVAGKEDPKEVEHTYGRIARSAIKHKTPDQAEKDIKRWEKVNKVINKEGVAEGLSEMDKSQTPPGRDGHISHGTYGSRDRKDSDAGKKQYTAKGITANQAITAATGILSKAFKDSQRVDPRTGKKMAKQGVAEGSGESYMIIRTDAEGKKDVFAGNFDTYEQAQKELDGLLAHPLHTKYKQKFEIKRKGQQGVAEGLVGDVVVHNYTKIPIDLEPGQAQIAGWGPNDEPLYRVKGQDGKEVKTWSKRRMLTIAKEQGVAEGSGDKTAQQRKTERDKQRTAPAQKARNQAQRKGLQQDKDGTYYAKEQGVAEGSPFSYGAKKPRKGSVADLAAKKRQEQERGKQPIEPKDQQVGVAKVTKVVAEGSTDDPRFQKMMGNIQQSTPNPVSGYVAVSYASERPSKKIKGVTYNGKPMPSTVDPEGFSSSKIKFTPDQIETKLAGIGQKYGWDSIDPGHGQGYDELYFDTSTKYTSATQRKLATNIVKTVNEINKFFNDINRSLQATGLPGYKANVWQGMGENGNINQYEDLSHITNIAKGQTAKPDAGPAIGKIILKHLPSYEAENDELGYDPQDFQDARNIANIYITKGERAGLQAQHDYDEVSDMIDELLSDAGASGLRTIWDDDEQGVAEGLNEFDAQGFQQRYTLYKDGYEIEKFGDIDDAIEYAEDDRRDGDDPSAVYKIVDINKQVVWDSDPYEKPSRIQLRKPEQGVAEGLTENVYSLEQAHAIFDDFEQAMADRGLTEDIFDFFTDEEIILESAAWRRSAGKSKKGGLNAKGVASYRRENPGSKLQMAVTTKPSKLKPGSKAAKRRKSFCARMGGVKGPMKKPNGKPTRKALALRKWNC